MGEPGAGARGPGRRAAAGSRDTMERGLHARKCQRFILRLFVSGLSITSTHAVERVRGFCRQYLRGRCRLEVIDIYQLPALAREQQILATPTLIKMGPRPVRRFIGDLSSPERLLAGLGLRREG